MGELLDPIEPRKPLIIGLGHPLRRDDGLGLHILGELQASCSPFTDSLTCGQEVLCWLSQLMHRPQLIILDAIDGGYPPGTVIRLVRSGDGLLDMLSLDEAHSHDSNLGLALALIRQKGVPLPAAVVYGIQPFDIGLGNGLTPCVARALNFLVKQLVSDGPWHNTKCLSDAVWLASDQIIHERIGKKMHGLAWMEEVLREIEVASTCHDLKKIVKVTLRRGELSHHSQEELELAWELKKDTLCQQAVLVIEEEPALIRCPACRWEARWRSDLLYCQMCGGRVELVSGTDLQLVSIQGI